MPPSRPRSRRIAGFAIKAGLAATSALLCIGMLELIVRVAMPQQLISIRGDIWAPDDGLGWVVRPEIDTSINTGERTVRVRTDADGFRIGEAGRRDGECEVLLLGDSFMQALQVEHEASLAGRMEAGFAKSHGDGRVAVRNAGVDGWGPSQYLIRARKRLQHAPPDALVVAVYLGNDIVHRIDEHVAPRAPEVVHELALPSSLDWREWVADVFYPINDWLEVRSHLFILVKTRLRGLLTKMGLSADYMPFGVRIADADDPMWDVTADAFERIADMAQAANRPVLFVLIPPPFAIDPAVFEQLSRGFGVAPETLDPQQPEKRIRALLVERGIPVASALGPFQQAHDDGVQIYGRIDRHLSPEGHALLHGVIAAELEQMVEGCVSRGADYGSSAGGGS